MITNSKKFLYLGGIFVLLTFLFDFISFWFVETYTGAFWVSICFANASIFVFSLSSIGVVNKKQYKYIEYPSIMLISSYYIVCSLLNLCFILFGLQNIKANVFINIILLVVYLIILFVILASNADTVVQMENDRMERNAYYSIKDKAQLMLEKSENRQINKKIESLYDRICSCQINNSTKVSNIDSEIYQRLDELSKIASSNDIEIVNQKIKEIMLLIDERDMYITNNLKR